MSYAYPERPLDPPEPGMPRYEEDCQYCEGCGECGDYLDPWWNRVDDLFFCDSCYEDLDVCGVCDERFSGESLSLEGREEVFCSEECRETAKEEWEK